MCRVVSCPALARFRDVTSTELVLLGERQDGGAGSRAVLTLAGEGQNFLRRCNRFQEKRGRHGEGGVWDAVVGKLDVYSMFGVLWDMHYGGEVRAFAVKPRSHDVVIHFVVVLFINGGSEDESMNVERERLSPRSCGGVEGTRMPENIVHVQRVPYIHFPASSRIINSFWPSHV